MHPSLTESLDQEEKSGFSDIDEKQKMSFKTKIAVIICGVLSVILLVLIIYFVVRQEDSNIDDDPSGSETTTWTYIPTLTPIPTPKTYNCGSGLTCILYENTLNISGSGEMINTYPWFDERSIVYTIIIEDNATTIGDYAFAYCDNLTKITIGNSIRSIGTAAFYYCSQLAEIIIPDSVITI